MFGLNKKYYINFETNCDQKLEPLCLKNKEAIPALPNVNKEGYKFMGWFKDPKFEISFEQKTMTKKDFTIYAKWEVISIDEFLNDVNFYTKSSNILQNLQNDYSDVPNFRDENKDSKVAKKKVTKKKTTKKTTSKKKTTKTKSTKVTKKEDVEVENEEVRDEASGEE